MEIHLLIQSAKILFFEYQYFLKKKSPIIQSRLLILSEQTSPFPSDIPTAGPCLLIPNA